MYIGAFCWYSMHKNRVDHNQTACSRLSYVTAQHSMFVPKGIDQACRPSVAEVRGACVPQNQCRVAGKFCAKSYRRLTFSYAWRRMLARCCSGKLSTCCTICPMASDDVGSIKKPVPPASI